MVQNHKIVNIYTICQVGTIYHQTSTRLLLPTNFSPSPKNNMQLPDSPREVHAISIPRTGMRRLSVLPFSNASHLLQ